MELIKDDETSLTIRFEKLEFVHLRKIIHVATLEYESLSVDVHNLAKEQFEKIEDALYSVA